MPGTATTIAVATADPAASLRARYSTMRDRLENSPFHQDLYLESVESPGAIRGDTFALVDFPFDTVNDAFRNPAHWCEALILHLNVKYCHAIARDNRPMLSTAIGRKIEEPLDDAYRVEFEFRVPPSAPDYFEVDLHADKGPLATSNYRIVLQAVGIDQGHTFLHLGYAYDYSLEARIAMKAYLATSGGNKVGFTMVPAGNDRPAHLVGGLRGAVERNTMRYYLALDAYLDTLAMPPPNRFERSMDLWFTATERYSQQLHEVDRDTYLEMKRREYARQQTLQ